MAVRRKTYSPTKVTRSLFDTESYFWKELETYMDATVRDNGADGFLKAPQAMLRAHPNTAKLQKEWDEHDEWFMCEGDLVKHYGKELEGYVLDCDGDVALLRIMGTVISHRSWGHGSEEFVVLVTDADEDGSWDGFGMARSDKMRFEQWVVRLKKD